MGRLVIICIDDESMVLESLRAELRTGLGNQYQIEVAEGGQEALDLVEELHQEGLEVALIISDYIMPEMKGDQCLTLMGDRAPEALRIMLTGQADMEGITNAINQAGLYRFITKPWQSEDLRLTVLKAIDSYQQQQQLAAKTQALEAAVERLQHQEQQLAHYNRTLEQRVTERTQALSQALTNLKAAQESIVQSEKMAALGQLIAGIAHEINTPLGAIQASISNLTTATQYTLVHLPTLFQNLTAERQQDFLNLLTWIQQDLPPLSSREERQVRRQLQGTLGDLGLPEPDSLAQHLVDLGILQVSAALIPLLEAPECFAILEAALNLATIRKTGTNIQLAVEKTSKIVFALKTYAHRGLSTQRSPVKLSESLEVVLTIYSNALKQGIEVVKRYGPVPEILGYPDELHQVWTNLLHNALHAMGGQGTLEIDLDQRGQEIWVTFTDSGVGISSADQAKIFEPFFTTKPMGEGSGLGLSIVQGIVKKHQGHISVDSQPGRTSFTMVFPILPWTETSPSPAPDPGMD